MAQLTRRQRLALTFLGVANVLILGAISVLLLRTPAASDSSFSSSPLALARLQACHQAASQALFSIGQGGMVHAHEDGRLLIQLERTVTTGSLRLDADAATWSVFEVIAHQGECLRFQVVEVTVILSKSAVGENPDLDEDLRALALVQMPDLMQWSSGEIDDAELARRLEYHPPTTSSPPSPVATTIP